MKRTATTQITNRTTPIMLTAAIAPECEADLSVLVSVTFDTYGENIISLNPAFS